MMMLMTPAHMHMSVDVSSRVGISASKTVGAPGTQGATVAGMQGMGVRTPIAAAVAAATIGFAGDIHIPNGMMFSSGMLSMMLASGISSVSTMFVGNTTSELGAMPIVHIKVAPMQTCIGIQELLANRLAGILAKPQANAMSRMALPLVRLQRNFGGEGVF
jgi:hypothetical protein